MSWHCLQAQEEASWEGSCLDGAPSALLNMMPMRGESCSPDNATDACQDSPSGTTSAHSMEGHGKVTSTSFQAGSHARTSAPQERAQESPGSGQGYGERWPESLAKWDPDTSSWKTRQCSLFGGLESFSETWPRWGMMRDGECWALTTPEHLTKETGSGLWPTVRSSDGERGGRGDLIQAVRGNPNSHYRMWPTPTACMSNGSSPAALTRKSGESRENDRLDHAVMAANGGQLNPTWVEWLMGWPLGWTDCAASATDRFQQWCDSHGRH